MSTEKTNITTWTPEQNATIDGLQQKLGWSRVQAIHKLRQGEKAGKTPEQILAEATVPKQKPAKAKPAAKPKAKREPKVKGERKQVQGKYNQAKVVELYMEQGKSVRQISESKLAGVVGISRIFVHRILFGSKNSGGVSPEQSARRKEQKARMDAARLARKAAEKDAK